jgi:hypothetical protein
VLRDQQSRDAMELIQRSSEWAHDAKVSAYRCEVGADHMLSFVPLDHHAEG